MSRGDTRRLNGYYFLMATPRWPADFGIVAYSRSGEHSSTGSGKTYHRVIVVVSINDLQLTILYEVLKHCDFIYPAKGVGGGEPRPGSNPGFSAKGPASNKMQGLFLRL